MDARAVRKAGSFSIAGRLGRGRYWQAMLVGTLACLVLLALWAVALGLLFGVEVKSVRVGFLDVFAYPPSWPFRVGFEESASSSRGAVVALFRAGATPIFLAAMFYMASATLRRLHDRNHSGWWLPALMILPASTDAAVAWVDNPTLALAVAAVGTGLCVWGLVELLLLRGTPGTNRFGSDPLARDAGHSAAAPWDQQSELDMVPHRAGPPPMGTVSIGRRDPERGR